MSNPPYFFSPLEPTYRRQFIQTPNGRVKWYVEVDQPREFLTGGICETRRQARAAVERAVARHLRQVTDAIGGSD
jgi:hypothetical protein